MKSDSSINQSNFAIFKPNLKLMAAFIIIITLFLIITLFSINNNKRYLRISNELKSTSLLMKNLEVIHYQSQEILYGDSEYLRSVDSTYSNIFEESVSEISVNGQELSALAKKSQSNQILIDSLNEYLDHIKQYGLSLIAVKNQNKRHHQLQPNPVQKIDVRNNEISRLVFELENEGRLRLRNLEAEQQQLALRATTISLTDAIFSLIIIILVFGVLQREFNKRKLAREELKQLNRDLEDKVEKKTLELNHIFERITDAFVALDTNWCYTYVNKKAAELVMRNARDLINKNIWEEFPESIESPFYTACHEAMSDQKNILLELNYEPLHTWFEIHLYPSKNGLSVFFRDIGAKKRTEEQLITYSERFNLIAKATTDVVWDLDLINDHLWWNENYYKHFGFPKDNSQLKIDSWYNIIHPEDRQRVISGIKDTINTGKQLWFDEYRLIKANGETVVVLDRGYILLDHNSRPYRMVGAMTNITERKKAEDLLTTEKELSESVINSLPGIFCLTKEDGKLLQWNKNFETITGYLPSELIQMYAFEFFDQQDKDLIHRMMGNILSDGPVEFEADFLTKSGKKISYYFTGRKLMYYGETTLLGMGIDITELKKAKEQLIAENELSDSIINSLPGVFYLFDESGNILRWNRNFVAASGCSDEEIKSMHILDFFEGNKRNKVKESIDKVYKNGQAEVEIDFVNPEGKSTPYYINGSVINYRNKRCIIGLGIDIAARREAEMLMQESEAKYRAFFENSLDGIMLTVKDGAVLAANRAACEIFGMTEEEIQHAGREGLVDMTDQRLPELLSRRNETGKARGELTFKRKDGSKFTGEISSVVYTNAAGQERTSMIIRDITERKKAETAIMNSQAELQKLTTHLQTIREEERSGIAREIHDVLGQQMTALKYDLTWLRKKRGHNETEIENKLIAMNQLLDDTIQSIRKISSELRPRILDDLGLNAAIEWYAGVFEKNTEIKCILNSNIEGIHFDKLVSITIYRIIQEALTNVARHSGATSVIINMEKTDGNLKVEISDNGKGISDADIGNLASLGLFGMAERAKMINGILEIKKHHITGTSVILKVPLH